MMKGMTDVSTGASQVKSAKGGKVYSAPRTRNSFYLDIFNLNIERSRLGQEQANLEKRRSQIQTKMERNQKRLDEISAQMRVIAKHIEEEESGKVTPPGPEVRVPPRKWRTVAVNY